MTLIKVTHANHRSTVYVVRELIGGWYHSPGNKCTHIVLSGGAVFPAIESVEDVERIYKSSETPKTESMTTRQQPGKKPNSDKE